MIESDRELKFAAPTVGTASYIQTAMLTDVFNLPVRILTGFSSKESTAAMIKGEIDGVFISESNVAKVIKIGAGIPILRFGESHSSQYASVESGSSIAHSDEQKLFVSQVEIMTELGRVTLAPADIAEKELKTLQTAYQNALTDVELLDEATTLGITIDMLPGPEVQELVKSFLNAPESFQKLVQKAYTIQ